MPRYAEFFWTDEAFNTELGRARRLNFPEKYTQAMADIRDLIIRRAGDCVLSN